MFLDFFSFFSFWDKKVTIKMENDFDNFAIKELTRFNIS